LTDQHILSFVRWAANRS